MMRLEYRGDFSDAEFFTKRLRRVGEEPEHLHRRRDLRVQHEGAVTADVAHHDDASRLGTPPPARRRRILARPGALRAAAHGAVSPPRGRLCRRRRRQGQAGGRAVLARYADRMDGLVRDIAAPSSQASRRRIAICARRRLRPAHALPALRHRPADRLRRADRRRRGALRSTRCCSRCGISGSTVGQHVRELADFDQVETDNPELLMALFDLRLAHRRRRAVRPVCSARSRRRPRARAPLRSACCSTLMDERLRRFNSDALSARAGRQEGAGRRCGTSRRSGCSARCGPTSLRRRERRPEGERADEAEEFLFRVRSRPARRQRPQHQRAHARAAGAGGRGDGHAPGGTRSSASRR